MQQKKIYILHGWALGPGNEKKWDSFRSLLKKNGYESIFLQIPGLDTPLNEPWNLDTYVAWLHEIITATETESIILLGHSFGGQIAARFSANYPDLVSQLVLLDSAGIRDVSLFARVHRAVFLMLAKIGKRITTHPQIKKILYSLAGNHDYRLAHGHTKTTMRSVIAESIADDLPLITAPTCIIWGENDTMTPLWMGQTIHAAVPQSQLVRIPHARHSPQFTHPEETVAAIVDAM